MPGLRGALAVRVNDGQSDRLVTRYCRSLKFTKVAPGGHRSINFTMVLPRNTFSDLGPDDKVYVYDARSGKTVIEGYLENPSPIDGPNGQQYNVSAVGGMALASDETRALIYIDQTLDQWTKANDSAPSANVETGNMVAAGLGGRVQFQSGQPLVTGSIANLGYYGIQRAGMTIGAINFTWQGGKTDANYFQELVTSSGTTIGGGMSTTPGSLAAFVVTDFIAGANVVGFRLRRVGVATNVADDTTWMSIINLSILGQRMNRNGTLLTAAAGLVSATQVLASQVVEDLLGRLLTFCDPTSAQVDATTFGITQLAWPDGIKAADVLTQLSVFESGYLWEILESFDSGKHRFNYRAWPTTPRYEISVRDGWQQTGSDVDLCNRILVTWTDATGATQVTTVTASSLGLVGLGYPVDQLGSRIKDADPITLPEGFGSSANATRVGGQILTDKINPPRAGTAVVRRPIIDQVTGNTVMPWEIEPGYLCRVRELGDELRITQADYDDDSCSTTLTLGRPLLTNEQLLAQLARAFNPISA
jgi:hypothetical protein